MIPQFEVTPVFERNFDSAHRIKINRGGTRSSKTYSICQLLVFWLFTGYIGQNRRIPAGVASVVRKTFPALKATAYRDIIEILHANNLYSLTQENKTEHLITYQGRTLEFFSADDEQKVRGRKRAILYCNEANELHYKQEFFQLLMRTTDDVFLDFNPDDVNIWINTELEQRRKVEKQDVEVIISNYKDNTFLNETTVSEIEYLQKTDPQFWKIFGLGEYGNITGLIFETKQVAQIPQNATLVAVGLDFGFTNDPTACIEVYQVGGELWLNELIFETGLTNQDIHERLQELGLNKRTEIIADSAEPKSIEELYRLGWNIQPAQKGPDSIKNGIDILKRYPLNITTRSVNTLRESKSYKWATDKNGNSLNKPIDFNNHAWDAIRYVALNKLSHAITPKRPTKAAGFF
jgi:phage terminase large subunit